MRRTTDGRMPDPKPCPHCGSALEVRTAELMGRRVFCGWEPCGCAGAAAERAAWEAERERAEHAVEAAAWERKADAAGIPPRYRDAAHPWARRMADRIKDGGGFYLHGPNGTGKTTLACAAALLCMRDGMSVRFATATELLEELRGFDGDQRGLLESLARCDLLVVDDLGKEGAATPRAAEKLFDMFNRRYNEQTLMHPRPVLVTSNFPRGQVAARVSEGGSGVAIASRLAEMTKAVEMAGEDRRLGGGSDG